MPNFAVAPENLVKRVGNGTLYIENNALKFRDGNDNVFTLVNTQDYLINTFEGFQGQPFSRMFCSSQAALTSQQFHVLATPFRAGQLLTSLHMAISTAGAGTAPSVFRLALVSKAGVVLRLTANIASDPLLISTGTKMVPLSSPYTIPADDLYYLGPYINGAFGATNLQLARSAVITGGLMPGQPGQPPSCTANPGTDLPAEGGSVTFGTLAGSGFWIGAS